MRNGETTLQYLLAPIQPMLDDPSVTEVVCNQPHELGIERGGQWEWHDIPEFDERRLDAIGIIAGYLLSKPFDPAHPICKTNLPGMKRATFVRQPVVQVPSMTIRIPSKNKSSVRDKQFKDAFDEPMALDREDAELHRLYQCGDVSELLSMAVRRKWNIAAIGETGHGKTHFLRTVMQEIPEDERVLTIEDTSEFGPLVHNRVEMIFGSAGIAATDLVEISLRMRPDRIALQELRGEEIWAYKRLLAAGYRGSFTTWHAPREEPFEALVLMAKQTPMGQSMDANDLNESFRRNIDIIVHCHKNRATNTYSHKIVWFRGEVCHA